MSSTADAKESEKVAQKMLMMEAISDEFVERGSSSAKRFYIYETKS